MLRPILCGDINTQWQEIKNYVKFILKNYFSKMFQLLLIFLKYIIASIISSTHITCDFMCVQYVIKNY